MTVLIPYEKGLLMRMVHERCQMIRESYVQGGLMATVRASARMHDTLLPYQVEDVPEPGEDGSPFLEGSQEHGDAE